MAQAILSLHSQGPHILGGDETTSFYALPALFDSSMSRISFRALLRTTRCLRHSTHFFISPFLHTLLLTETGTVRAPDEGLLRSHWCVTEVSLVGVGRPTVRRLATPSHRIWCVP